VFGWWQFGMVDIRVRPIPCRHPIPDTMGHSYTDTDTGCTNFLY